MIEAKNISFDDLAREPTLWVSVVRDSLSHDLHLNSKNLNLLLPNGSDPLKAYAIDFDLNKIESHQLPTWIMDDETRSEVITWFSHFFSPTEENIRKFHNFSVDFVKGIFDPKSKVHKVMPNRIKDFVTTTKNQLAFKIKANAGSFKLSKNPVDSYYEHSDLQNLYDTLKDCPYDLTLSNGENLITLLEKKLGLTR